MTFPPAIPFHSNDRELIDWLTRAPECDDHDDQHPRSGIERGLVCSDPDMDHERIPFEPVVPVAYGGRS